MDLLIELLKSILFGLVQGITEWLPISSTGHLILLNTVLPLKVFDDPSANLSFWNMYKVLIQLGSILAVILIYFRKLWPFSAGIAKKTRKSIFRTWLLIIIASIPCGILGYLLNDLVDEKLSSPLIIGVALVAYGILFLIAERKAVEIKYKKVPDISPSAAFFTGLFESLALVPGTSRSGATIIGGLLLGMNRSAAAEFSFFLAIPVMLGASALKLMKMKTAVTLVSVLVLAVGMITAFIVSVSVIRSLMKYIKTHSFRIFGFYRIVLGIIILILSVLELIPKGVY
ncbi:MAG: undecaprenyl-diphosphate phosphatase [Solobacterium sp.]|nr:undecaprenyl-diphosphate phosphatase [Solobacterium sp.]